MKKTVFTAVLVLVAGCVTTKVATSGPSQADIDRVQSKFPGYTLAELNEGKALYEKNCNLCHELIAPPKESEATWRREVPPMVVKSNKKQGGNAIDAKGEELILKYVVTMSGAGK